MDYAKINEAAQNYLEDMTRFLRAIVKNPGESCDEKAHIDTIAAEMKKLDFDQVVIDQMCIRDRLWAVRNPLPLPMQQLRRGRFWVNSRIPLKCI